jgi:hypothetical protein
MRVAFSSFGRLATQPRHQPAQLGNEGLFLVPALRQRIERRSLRFTQLAQPVESLAEVTADADLAHQRFLFGIERGNPAAATVNRRRRRALAERHPSGGSGQDRHRFVR